MLFAIHNETVIDFICKDQKAEFSCNLDDLEKDFLRIENTGRVVRIDDNDCFCLICDLGTDILNVRIPVGLFVTGIEDRFTIFEIYGIAPEGVTRRRKIKEE